MPCSHLSMQSTTGSPAFLHDATTIARTHYIGVDTRRQFCSEGLPFVNIDTNDTHKQFENENVSS